MNGYPAPGPWAAITKDLARPGRRSVIAVVAFIGRHAPSVMPLQRGDLLVCDASDVAIKQQLTSPASLRSYHRKGVTIFSIQGLHAKVIASPTSAWVGSANASKNSSEHLVEASVRVTGAEARRVHSWAESLATEDHKLSLADIARLAKLKTYPRRPGPRVEVTPTQIPNTLNSIVFIETGERLTKQEHAEIKADASSARTAARATGFSSKLNSILTWSTTGIKVGDWVIDIRNGHVRKPAVVVRKKKSRSGWVIWMSEGDFTSRPSVATVRELHPQIINEFGEFRLTGNAAVRKVVRLFG